MAKPAGISWENFSYRQLAIDLGSGKLLPRQSTSWRSELYFMEVEAKDLKTRADERMNVTHSLDPATVSCEALVLLNRAFASSCEANHPCAGAAFAAAPQP
ncbi:unnamed protein product [Polarella glacialis]|uniref:Uncharacterized protein n=1 Tax=Polarella glacialis TaxID=89957 RepID=A0A813DIT0_POLGL|nr:unnamed protein product [Polarella glacialis]